MNKLKEIDIRIRQRKDECHYETSIEKRGFPLIVEYGLSQEESDTKAIKKLIYKFIKEK